jgi:hypothetical protein
LQAYYRYFSARVKRNSANFLNQVFKFTGGFSTVGAARKNLAETDFFLSMLCAKV